LGGPDFFDLAEYPEGIAGGCVYSLVGAWELLIPTEPIDLVDVQFQTTIDDELGDYHELRWVNGIGGPPPVTNIVVGSGSSWVPILRHGRVRLEHRATPAFIRGDCSASDEIDLGDVLTVLDYLFGPGVGYVDCRDACDIDGDGLLQIGDPISLLEYLFLGGPAPPAPFPECLASAVVLGCETPSCP